VLRTLIVGLGHAGLDLHWKVLRRLRESAGDRELFASGPVYGLDLRKHAARQPGDDLTPVRSLAEAARLLDPAETVVHLCTPPVARLDLLHSLADLGFRRILVEKPLTTDLASAEAIAELGRSAGLDLTVVAHWLDSALTAQCTELIRSGRLGELRAISFVQRKPRLSRTIMSHGHPTAFDAELPHSVAVSLRLAGDARLLDASWTDMQVGDQLLPRMGTARLVARHENGAHTEIFSDLTSPVRERRVTFELSGGRVVGHYPSSKDDDYAHLRLVVDGRELRSVFRDDSMANFLRRVYRQYAEGRDGSAEFALNMRVTALLSEAKSWCLAREARVGEQADGVSGPRLAHGTKGAKGANGAQGLARLLPLNDRGGGMERIG
jgi:predicted dehydrogenase